MRTGIRMTLLLAGAVASVGADVSLTETRATLEKWVQARQLAARQQADWRLEKETLEATAALYERELKTLQEQLAAAAESGVQTGTERTDLEKQLASLESQEARAAALAGELEASVRRLAPRFPEPLREKVAALLARIPAEGQEARGSSGERLQAVVALLGEADKFNGAVHVVSELRRNPQGEEVQVRTLYLGLGQAWFVDATGSYAGTGVPGVAGWEWTARGDLADTVTRAIAMYENTQPVAFLGLPVRIQ